MLAAWSAPAAYVRAACGRRLGGRVVAATGLSPNELAWAHRDSFDLLGNATALAGRTPLTGPGLDWGCHVGGETAGIAEACEAACAERGAPCQ